MVRPRQRTATTHTVRESPPAPFPGGTHRGLGRATTTRGAWTLSSWQWASRPGGVGWLIAKGNRRCADIPRAASACSMSHLSKTLAPNDDRFGLTARGFQSNHV